MLSFGANTNKKKWRYASGVFTFLLVVGFVYPHFAHAECGVIFGNPLDCLGDGIALAIKGVLYMIFTVIGWFVSGAVTIFQWAVDPSVYGNTGLFNKAAVYNMWKLIRDFLNLFFILTLLYTAFTIVFQVASNYKKTLLSIVLAALFVNFSFPITRVIIDATNVPMYYFINLIMTSGASPNPNISVAAGQGALGPALSASGLKNILIPEKDGLSKITVAQLLSAIVFMFVFMVTLMVLAVMFVIRMVALLLLVIFSPVGFAASIIPGLKRYSDMWWDKLWSYTFFGPAAMLMLYIATQFFAEISKDDTLKNMKLATQNNAASGSDFFASMGMYAITIIMLWMTIGLANAMSIAGAAAVAGKGEKFLKWAGKKTYNNPVGRGLYGGAKKSLMEGKVFGGNYGKFAPALTGNYWAKPSKTEARIKGGIAGGVTGARTEIDKLHQQEVNKAVKENRDNQVNRSTLLRDLESKDDVERQAAAMTLAENGEIRSAQDLAAALKAVARKLDEHGNPVHDEASADMAARVIDKAKDGATSGMTKDQYQSIAGNDVFYVKKADGKTRETKADGSDIPAAALEALDGKLKKDGNLHLKVNFKIDEEMQKSQAAGVRISPEMARDRVYDKMVHPLSSEDLVKQTDLHGQSEFKDYFQKKLSENPKRIQTLLEKAHEKGKPKVQEVWRSIAENEGEAEEMRRKAAEPARDSAKEEAEATKNLRETLRKRHGKA